jgi:hypothetical protein
MSELSSNRVSTSHESEGSGAAEWLIVGTFALIAAAAVGGAGVAWRCVALRP